MDQSERIATARAAAQAVRQSLLQQIEEKSRRIVDERRKEIEVERRNEEIQNEMEMERLARETEEREQRLKRLAELEAIADSQLNEANAQIEHLHREIESRTGDGNGNLMAVSAQTTIATTDDATSSHRTTVAHDEALRNRCYNIASSIIFGNLRVNTGVTTDSVPPRAPNIIQMDDNLNPIATAVQQKPQTAAHAIHSSNDNRKNCEN